MVKDKILIIGGCGYIGSKLCQELESTYDVESVDVEWYGNFSNPKNIKKDFCDMTKDDLSKYRSVILLAGHSSVKMCDKNLLPTLKNNVLNFAKLLENLDNSQKFIYASSSSVYGDTENNYVDEEYVNFRPNNYYDLSKYEIDAYASLSDKFYFGLRFGTVNGYSPNLRNDVMINAMTFNAVENGKIFCFNPKVNRPILGITDLCRAVKSILSEASYEDRGIYNLASFNSNVEEIATAVANTTGAEIEMCPPPEHITNIKLQTKSYDFLIKTEKFENRFNFKFEDTIESIVNTLLDNYDNMNKGSRASAKIY
tara:strand:+ start:443 stop:1378 length:936 start_codon:yes stop_codon:yes gene_type:complete